MKGLFFVIGGLLGACMLVLGPTALAQGQPVAVSQQPGSPAQAMAPEEEKPAASQPPQGKKQRKSQKKNQTRQDADR